MNVDAAHQSEPNGVENSGGTSMRICMHACINKCSHTRVSRTGSRTLAASGHRQRWDGYTGGRYLLIFSSIRATVLIGARITCNICTYFGDKHDNDAMGVCKDVHAYICMLACYMHRERERGGLGREREREEE